MTEKTIFKPRPGGRTQANNAKPAASATPAARPGASVAQPDDNNTLFVQPKNKAFSQSILSLSDNPLIDHAGVILSLINQIKVNAEFNQVDNLYTQCIDLIDKYESQLQALKFSNKLSGKTETIDNKLIDAAKLCACAFIDEVVMSMPWGRDSSWAQSSLQSHYYQETFAGTYFYNLLDEATANMAEMYMVVELQYLCLSLGFQGKYRLDKNASQIIDSLRDNLSQMIKGHSGKLDKKLSVNLKIENKVSRKSKFQVPIWVIGSLAGALLVVSFIGLRVDVNEQSDAVYSQVLNLVPRHTETASRLSTSALTIKLEQLLQTEIRKQILVVQELSDRIRIRLTSADLFASASEKINPIYQPVLRKIARTLESTQGQILITGHTDSHQILTSRYPSNWHLSLARATTIADILAQGTSLGGRLLPEGRGESEPLVTDGDSTDQAVNRRVEIDILR